MPLKNLTKPIIIAALAIMFAIAGCKRDKDYSNWDTNMLTPIASTSLSLDNLLTDSMLRTQPDSSLLLVYDYPIYHADINELFYLPDTELRATFTLEKLVLTDRTLSQSITLGQVVPGAIVFNGQPFTIPAQNITTVPATPIDASSFFQTAVLKEGFMDVSIFNGFPVEIEELEFILINKVTGNILVNDKMTNITSGTSKTVTADLKGKKVDAALEVQVTRLKTYATPGPVIIDINDKVDIVVTVRGLKPLSATAIFPSQSVYSRDTNELYYFGGAEVKKLRMKSGKIRLRVVSTIQENMTVFYQIPHSIKNGNSINEVMKVPAAPPGGSTDMIRDIPLDGYTIDMRGKNPTVDDLINSFYNIRNAVLDSSGKVNSVSLNDSIFLYFGLLDLVPEWAEGYLGQLNLSSGSSASEFNFFKNNNGTLDFEKIDLAIDITNGVGADARVNIKNIYSSNTRTGTKIPLNATQLNSPLNIAPATDNPFKETKMQIKVDETNSNIQAFVKNMPDRLEYDIDVTTNPNGNVRNWKDFIYNSSIVSANLKLTMPLSLRAENLTLMDTLPFEMFSTGSLERVKEGTFNIIVNNTFPFSAAVQLYIVNESGTIIDSLMGTQNNTIASGFVDLSGKVTSPTKSVLKAYFSKERMDKIKIGKKLLVKATFDTPKNSSKPVKIYSHYKFDVKLTGDFVYEQRF